MGATRIFIGGAILGLFWGGISLTIANNNINNNNNNNNDNFDSICESSACICDDFGRLTCDCSDKLEELILKAEGEWRVSSHTSRIVVKNCPSAVLMNSSLSSMNGLKSIEFININNLTLYTQSFELSQKTSRAIISIHSASIDVLPSFVFKGDIESISFENVEIGLVSAFAFANLAGTDTLRLEDCQVYAMEEQAFKKFDVNRLHVIGGNFGDQIPSRTMNDLEVFTTFQLDGVTMGTVRSSAFVIKKPKTVSIQNCFIDTVEGEAFDISTRGTVLIKNNHFTNLAAGSFLGIKADNDGESRIASVDDTLPEIAFNNNTLENFEEGSVIFDRSSFRPIIDNVFINKTCDCQQLSIWKSNILNYSKVYTRLYTGNTLLQPGMTTLEPIEEGTFSCFHESRDFITFREFMAHNCALGNSTMLFLLVLVGLLVLLIIGIVLIVWCCRQHHGHGQKRWISVPTSAPDVVSKKNGVINRDGTTSTTAPVDSRITMVVPDGRLYRETEFHVIVEKAEPLTTEL